MSIFDRVLHIPAEPRPFVEPRALTRVTLPLRARPGGRFAVALVAAIAVAVACLWLAIVLAGAVDEGLVKYCLAATFAVAALVPAGVAVTAMRDWLAVLTVDGSGLRDTRFAGETIAWSDVAAAAIVGATNGIAAVRLTLRADRAPRYNPFRIGGWSAEWRHRRRERIVALTLLDRRAHDLAHSIVILAGRHGATVDAGPASTADRP